MVKERFSAPDEDELEVSVFGPGRGECIIVHVPNGPWFIVDSLTIKDEDRTLPVATAYLKNGLGISSVYGVFLTHWHEDHTNGAADLLRTFADTIKIVGLPNSFGRREFASFMSDLLPSAIRFRMVKDIVNVIEALKDPLLENTMRIPLSDRILLSPDNAHWTLRSLSPSFEDIRHQAKALGAFLPGFNGSIPKGYDVNASCAVIKLEVDAIRIILASDLDVGDSSQRGWQCIVNNHTNQNLPLSSLILKIGHHGSRTAFYQPALEAIRGDGQLFGVITPFPAPGHSLPRDEEVKKFLNFCSYVHQTGTCKSKSRAGRVATKNTPFLTYIPMSRGNLATIGQIRYRMRLNEVEPRIDVFTPAFKLGPSKQ